MEGKKKETKKTQNKKKEFCWTDDEVQLLLEVCYELKAESDYEGVNFESKRTKYELVKDRFCEQYPFVADEQYPRTNDLNSITKERVSVKIKSIRGNFKKAVDSGKKSGGGRIIFTFYDICERIWGGSPAVRSISNGNDTCKELDDSFNDEECEIPSNQEATNSGVNEDINGKISSDNESETAEQSTINESTISSSTEDSNETENKENETVSTVKKLTTERRKTVEEGLKGRRDKKLSSKLNSEAQLINLSKEELNLKRKMIENFEKSDIEYNTGLQKVLKTMDNISVDILAHLVHHQTQFHTQQMPFHNQVLSNGLGSSNQSRPNHAESHNNHNGMFQQEDDNRFY